VSDSLQVRIPAENLGNTAASQTSKPGETPRTANSAGTPGAGASVGEDRVEISSLSESIATASKVDNSQQADRVRQLGALYQSGKYQVDSLNVSRAIVAQALISGSTDNLLDR